ncbi:uncharacterized protein LOC112570390 [Pomacea canaliculata]|nr:uncharacterized protein LOC112570390 [Pomacea canaliculata]
MHETPRMSKRVYSPVPLILIMTRRSFSDMRPFLCLTWMGALLLFASCSATSPTQSEAGWTQKLGELEARLARVEEKREQRDTSDYGDFIEMDGWVLVFRGTQGLGSPVYDAWTRTGYHDDYTFTRASMPCGCTRTNGSCDRHYRSLLLDFWPSSALDKVKLAVYEGGVEKAYMIFTGLGSNYINWFSADRLVQSSWKDLKSSAHSYFDITGFSARGTFRRFYVSKNHGGCPGDNGWLNIKDAGNSCPWETSNQNPAFVYSKAETVINWQSAGDMRGFADVMAVWVKFRPSVNLNRACMP